MSGHFILEMCKEEQVFFLFFCESGEEGLPPAPVSLLFVSSTQILLLVGTMEDTFCKELVPEKI
jgi:hypothetical protein